MKIGEVWCLDTTKAHQLGDIESLGGMFRGENVTILEFIRADRVKVKMDNGFINQEFIVYPDCLIKQQPLSKEK
jgi:hypothetical protein